MINQQIVITADKVLLELVARAQAIVSRVCVLRIPKDFNDIKYHVLFPDAQTTIINARPDHMESIDEQLRSKHYRFLARLYSLLESIVLYSDQLKRYFHELENGYFIQENLTTVIGKLEGRQMLCESVYYLGVMLVLADVYIPAETRERLLNAFRRWSGPKANIPNFERVCKLFYRFPAENHPFDYFAIVELPEDIVLRIISRLCTDDIYNQLSHFSLPKHKTIALSTQASMIVVILMFTKESLKSNNVLMREIVDRHFSDNFVVSYFMGRLYDLSIIWQDLPAASKALSNTIEVHFFKSQVQNNFERALEMQKEITKMIPLMSGNDEYVLENVGHLMEATTEVNAVLSWLLRHQHAENKKLLQIYQQVSKQQEFNIMDLVFTSAYFEDLLKVKLTALVDQKPRLWQKYKQSAANRVQELSEVFSGSKPLTRVEKNVNLQEWFSKVNHEIENLSETNPLIAGRSLVRLIEALEEIKDLHQMDANIHLRSFIGESVTDLKNMLRLINAKQDTLVTLSQVTDFSYAWNLLPNHTKYMQLAIKNDPAYVGWLRATFLKMSSAMDISILRINQNHSDIVQASKFYSDYLVEFVQCVLQVIPETMFTFLDRIIDIQTDQLKPIPLRMTKSDAKAYCIQHNHRFELYKHVGSVSKFTDGYLALQKTLVGVVEVDPRALLEAGIKQELIKRLCQRVHEITVFGSQIDFASVIDSLGHYLNGMKSTLEFLQDFLLKLKGFSTWFDCWKQVVTAHCNEAYNQWSPEILFPHALSLTGQIVRLKSSYSKLHLNFMGRITEELIQITAPEKSVFVLELQSWYDLKSKSPVLTPVHFEKLLIALGNYGLFGLSQLLLGILKVKLDQMFTALSSEFQSLQSEGGLRDFLLMIKSKLAPASTIPASYSQLYPLILNTFEKIVTKSLASLTEIHSTLSEIGQLQLIRRMILIQLYEKYSTDVPCDLIISQLIQMHSLWSTDADLSHLPDIQFNTNILRQRIVSIPEFFDNQEVNFFPEFFLCVILSSLKKFDSKTPQDFLLPNNKKEKVDLYSFLAGILTINTQTGHLDDFPLLLAYLDQFIRSLLNGTGKSKDTDKVIKMVEMMQELDSNTSHFTCYLKSLHTI